MQKASLRLRSPDRTPLQETVRQLPSTIARLLFLAGLRDPNSGVYHHQPTRTGQADGADIPRLLRRMHEEAFSVWLSYRLEEQQADLDLYFSGLDCGKATAVANWLRLQPYRLLIPGSATSVERELFFGDLEVLLRAMAARYVPGFSDNAEQCGADRSDGPLIATEELSKWLGVSPRTLRLWAESDEIPAVKVGRQWRYTRRDIRQWLRRRKVLRSSFS